MIARRENFHRVYDLRERVLAGCGATRLPLPSNDDAARVRSSAAVRALGVTQARWIADYFRSGRSYKDADLDALVDRGELLRVAVDGWRRARLRASPIIADAAPRAARGRSARDAHDAAVAVRSGGLGPRARARHVRLRLSPRVLHARRRSGVYGYFVLPILHRGRLVGRLDAKAHRADGVFEVKALFLEAGVRPDDALVADLAFAIGRAAAWHGTPRVEIARTDPARVKRALNAALEMLLRSDPGESP